MLELILNGLAPMAIVLRDDVDSILCTGAIIAQEFFLGKEEELLDLSTTTTTLPSDVTAATAAAAASENHNVNRKRKRRIPIIVAVGEANFARLQGHTTLSIHEDENDEGTICITSESGDLNIRTPNLLKLPNTLSWGEFEDPTKFTTPAEIVAKRTISRIASVSSGATTPTTTTSVIPITSAHIDAVTYIGNGGLKFVQKLVELGGRVKVT